MKKVYNFVLLKILQLHALSVFDVRSTLGRAVLLFSALKRQKLANFPRAEPKAIFIFNQKIAVRPPKKTFSLAVIM